MVTDCFYTPTNGGWEDKFFKGTNFLLASASRSRFFVCHLSNLSSQLRCLNVLSRSFGTSFRSLRKVFKMTEETQTQNKRSKDQINFESRKKEASWRSDIAYAGDTCL
jgi:hypothetical protein